MSEEVKIKITQPLIEQAELETFDNYIHEIAKDYTNMILKEKDQILTQRLVMKLEEELQQKENIIKEVRNWINSTIDIIKQQPTGNDEWILERLNSFISLLDKDIRPYLLKGDGSND